MKLLSEFFAKTDANAIVQITQNAAGSQVHPLTVLVPRLWPFFRHNIVAVRLASIKTLAKLTQASNIDWIGPILTDCIRLIFQTIALDVDDQVVTSAKSLWTDLISKINAQYLMQLLSPVFQSWFRLLCTPAAQRLERGELFHPNFSNTLPGESEHPLSHKVVSSVKMQVDGVQALAFLSRQLTITFGQSNPFFQYASVLLGASNATGLQIASMLVAETFYQLSGLSVDLAYLVPIRDSLLNLLTTKRQTYYDELIPTLQQLHEDVSVLLVSFTNIGVNVQAAMGMEVVSPIAPPVALEIVTNVYPKLVALLPNNGTMKAYQDLMQQLEFRRQRVQNKIRQIEQGQASKDTATMATIVEAFLTFQTLPDKLNNIINPLVKSLKRQPDQLLQRRTAKAVAHLVQLYLARGGEPGKKNPLEILLSTIAGMMTITHETVAMDIDTTTPLPEASGQQKRRKRKRAESGDSPEKPRRKTAKHCKNEELAGDEDDGVKEDTMDIDKPEKVVEDSELESDIYAARGGKFAFEELSNLFGPSLFEKLPALWHLASFAIIGTGLDDSAKIQSLQVLQTLIPILVSELEPVITGILPQVIELVRVSTSSQVLELTAKCIAAACCKFNSSSMQIVLERLVPLLEISESATSHGVDNISTRMGAARAIHHIITTLDFSVLPWVVFLIIPLMGKMSDPSREVREMVTFSFAKLITLMPLESGIPDPPGMNPELIKQKQKERHFLEQLLDGSKVDNYDMPIKINGTLRKYQQEGVNWLAFLNKYNLHGILADDMGLGKTIQALCIVASDDIKCRERFAQTRAPHDQPLPSLIVCPSTLVHHWYDEIIKFYSNTVIPLEYYGLPLVRAELRDRFPEVHIVITSYEVLRNDIEILEKTTWNYVVLDEGHMIRNAKTRVTQAVKMIKARHRLILTGTPIQNNVLELWSLFDFLMPGFLGDQRQFKDMYSKPILQSHGAKASSHELERGERASEALHRQVLPFILRRVKEDVLQDLPPKIIQDHYCELSPLQGKLYHSFSATSRDGVAKGDKTHMFHLLQYLRNLCSHPRLVLTPNHPRYAEITANLTAPIDSITHAPKLLALKELLNECGIGVDAKREPGMETEGAVVGSLSQHRALIFCQTRTMLDIIETDLFKAHMPTVTYMRMDGTTPALQRPTMCKQFNQDPTIDCFLLTTSVGGLGLNLTGADTVIFIEHDWNPMKDLQAMDRAHRIGATKTVNVYRLITKGTLEEKIMGLQKFKLNIANTVVNKENQSFANMDTSQLLDLFNYPNPETTHKPKKNDTQQGLDSFGNVTVGTTAASAKGMKALVDSLDELWDESQYTEEYNLDNFLASLKG